MKTRFTLTLVTALAAATLAQAGFGITKSVSFNRSTIQPIQINPTPIQFTPVVPTVPAVIAQPVPQVQPQHLIDALQLVDEINATHALGIFEDNEGVEINRYGGSWSGNNPSYIRFMDENNGIYPSNFTECAPLVSRLLQHSYGWSWSNYVFQNPKEGGNDDTTASPNPWEYLALIEQNQGFEQQIHNIRQSKPGDIISMHYAGTQSGHTAILVELHLDEPMAYPNAGQNLVPELAGTHYYRMTVLDSTQSPHSNDTRRFTLVDDNDNETDYDTDGIGTGDMGIFLNLSGQIIGYTWSLPNSDYGTQGWLNGIADRLYLPHQRKMVFGRLPANP